MSRRDGSIAQAMRTARADQDRVLAELSRMRRTAGLSTRAVGRACGMSRPMVDRILNGRRPATIVELAAIGGAVGLDVRMRAYLAGDPIRDAGQQRLLDRFRRVLPPSISCRTEVPLPEPGDRRAWDALIRGSDWGVGVEAETVIDDVQALERRTMLKLRDGGADSVILVISDTPGNRRALAAAAGAFAGFDRNARRVLAALRAGRDPGGSGILFL